MLIIIPQDIIDKNRDILTGKDRGARNDLFRSIQNGDFHLDDYEQLMGVPPKPSKSIVHAR